MTKDVNLPQTFYATVAFSGQSLGECFAESGLSIGQIKQCQKYGALWLQTPQGKWQRLRRYKKPLTKGQKLSLYYLPKLYCEPLLKAQLVADEGDYSIWYKPSGMLSQGTKFGDINTVYRYSELHLTPQRPAFLVHRLDKAAQGLQIIAHSKKAAKAFTQMFESRQLSKTYQAKVHAPKKPALSKTIKNTIDGKAAVSHWQLISFDEKKATALLEVNIETGRKHQIRKHLSAEGFAIVGDRLYSQPPFTEDLQLLAWHLAFTCPLTGKLKMYQAPIKITL